MLKTCAECGAQYDGHGTSKTCSEECRKSRTARLHSESNRRWKKANRERAAELNRQWDEANPERKAELNRRWKEANRERAAELNRQWDEANPGRKAELNRRWYEANREYINEYFRNYRLDPDNREKHRRRSERNHRKQILALIDEHGPICHICGGPLDMTWEDPGLKPSIDHVIPLAAGGPDEWDNLKPAHLRCNIVKGDRVSYAAIEGP